MSAVRSTSSCPIVCCGKYGVFIRRSTPQQVRDFLNERLQIELPEEEAGNIAFHLVNAQTENPDMERTMQAMRMLKDIYGIIQLSFGRRLTRIRCIMRDF